VEYRLKGSQVASDVVYSTGKPAPLERSAASLRSATTGPTHEDLRRLARGDRIELVLAGRYRLERLLGCGGMGAVYLGQHVALRRRVAVKVLDVNEDDWRWAIARFLREAQLAARVRHRNIVEIYDFGTTPEGVVYIVMEHLTGRDLEAIVRRERLSWGWARYVMQQICAGIGAIHDVGVVHRDLKASNCFFVERSSAIKVLDFGIATTENREADEGIRAITGTPEYMPPEQIRGEAVDRRADVYAAGVLLCKLLTGRSPFHGYSAEEVFDRQLYAEPPTLAELADDLLVPAGVDEVIRRSLAKDPRRRYQSMRELSDALDMVEESSKLRRILRLPRTTTKHPLPSVGDADGEAPTCRFARLRQNDSDGSESGI
jgi:serine/threonine protein kinase